MKSWKIERHNEKMEPMEPIYVKADTITEAYLDAVLQLGPDFYPSSTKGGITSITLVENSVNSL